MQPDLQLGSLGGSLVLLVYALIAHGAILPNGGLYWDGWIVDLWQKRRDWASMRRFFAETGMPLLYHQHRAMAVFRDRPLAYRMLAFASTYAASVAVYLTARQFGFLNPDLALVLGLLYLAYTGYHMNVDTVCGLQYTFPTALFYIAAYFAFLAQTQSGYESWLLHAASASLFLVSFNANSLAVYYFVFFGVLILWLTGADPLALSGAALGAAALYLPLPFVFWVLKERFTPRHGSYAGYNRIRLGVKRIYGGYIQAMRHAVEAPVTRPLKYVVGENLVWVPVLLALAASYALQPVTFIQLDPAERAAALLLSIIALAAATFPYLAVGLIFREDGWGTKQSMLLHLPVSLLLLSLLAHSPTGVTVFIVAFVLVANAIWLNKVYAHHLAVYVKNLSWLSNLAAVPGASDIAILSVVDTHWLKGDPSQAEQEHRPAYLFAMFAGLWNDRTHFGIPEGHVRTSPYDRAEIDAEIARSTIAYDMESVDVAGPQAVVVISGGEIASVTTICRRYLRYRLTGNRQAFDNLLRQTSRVDVRPLGRA